MRRIIKFLFSDSTIFVTFVVSASDKKPSAKCQPKFFFVVVTILKETTENTEIRCLVFGF